MRSVLVEYYYQIYFSGLRGAAALTCKMRCLGVRFLFELMNYFYLLALITRQSDGVEDLHSTRNVSESGVRMS